MTPKLLLILSYWLTIFSPPTCKNDLRWERNSVARARVTLCDCVALPIYELMKSIYRISFLVLSFRIFKEIDAVLKSLSFDYPHIKMPYMST